jgi:hypothetical protein
MVAPLSGVPKKAELTNKIAMTMQPVSILQRATAAG